MPDKLTIEQRHKNMAAIRAKDTKPEIIVRRFLWSRGFRYRLNHPRLPGKPDIVLRKYRTCVFVNGCFWHGHLIHVPSTMYNVQMADNGEQPLHVSSTMYNVQLADNGEQPFHVPSTMYNVQMADNGEQPLHVPSTMYNVQLADNRKQAVNGEVHDSKCCKIPHTNREFWVRKIMRNKERDIEVQKKLAAMGWHSVTIWECELKGEKRAKTLEALVFTLNRIFLEDHKVKRYVLPEEDGYAMVAEDPHRE